MNIMHNCLIKAAVTCKHAFKSSYNPITSELDKSFLPRQYGVAVLRGVPTEQDHIVDVVKRFAYVKETQYGTTFDVINKPVVSVGPRNQREAIYGVHRKYVWVVQFDTYPTLFSIDVIYRRELT